ncbi:MAG: hypothetical protein P8Y97_20875 [Candidatus Lokiarchaeota archaeon]
MLRNGETISIPSKSHFSVGTSPYYAHQNGIAIDIYHHLTLNNYSVYSPVSGEIVLTKILKAPKPKFPEGEDKEYLIQIRSKKNPKIMFKILHVNTQFKKGDIIVKGDILGKTVRNGYFAPWSSPHLHLEIRKFGDINRAKGGLPFSFLMGKIKTKKISEDKISHIPVNIFHKFPEFLLGKFPKEHYLKFGHISGLKASYNKVKCIIDGGIPLYDNGILLLPSEIFSNDKKYKKPVYFANWEIGKIYNFRKKFGFIKFDKVQLFLGGVRLKGISLFLAKNFPFAKFIPEKRNAFKKIKRNILEFKINM